MCSEFENLASSRITFGLWPLSGVTTMGVTDVDRDETMQAAVDCGIRNFDTAFSYGLNGEADQLIHRHLSSQRDQCQIGGKVGQRYEDGVRVTRGDADTLRADAEHSLRRCGIDRFDTLLLHGVDPAVPIDDSAIAMRRLLEDELAGGVGLCNASIEQMQRFSEHCPITATQCGLNLLQQDALQDFVPWCVDRHIDVDVFWTLMKGLLAGRIRRGHQFEEGDSRLGYDIFQGQAFERAQSLIDRLELVANELDRSIAEISIGWAMSQPGVHRVLVGARKPSQVHEIAASATLPDHILKRICP